MPIEGTDLTVKVTRQGRELLEQIAKHTGMSVPQVGSDLLNGALNAERESYEALDRQQTRR